MNIRSHDFRYYRYELRKRFFWVLYWNYDFKSHCYSVLCYCSSKPTGFTSSVIFEGIEDALKKDGKSLVGKVKGIFAFKVKKTDGKFLEVIFQ